MLQAQTFTVGHTQPPSSPLPSFLPSFPYIAYISSLLLSFFFFILASLITIRLFLSPSFLLLSSSPLIQVVFLLSQYINRDRYTYIILLLFHLFRGSEGMGGFFHL